MQSPVSSHMARIRRLRPWTLSLLVALMFVACSGGAPTGPPPTTMRVGYFPNLTHSQALVGLARGDFQDRKSTRLNSSHT